MKTVVIIPAYNEEKSISEVIGDIPTDVVSEVIVVNNNSNDNTETTALNAAGGLIVANIANNFEEGVEIALETIKNGKAFGLLENFVKDTGDFQKLKEIVNGWKYFKKIGK